MPAAALPALEQRLEARLLELERLYEARPMMSDALGRAGAGQRIDELCHPGGRPAPPMSAMGQKRTFSDTLSNVCFWGQSGHWMSAF